MMNAIRKHSLALRVIVPALVAYGALTTEAPAATEVGISPSGHFFTYQGKTVFILGDAGTQVVPMNGNLDYKKWMDLCASLGQKAVLVWPWGAVSTVKPDPRLCDYAGSKALLPWKLVGGKYDFLQTNESYWSRMDAIASYAKHKGLILVVTVFWGWAKDGGNTPTWIYHPMKDGNAVQTGLCTLPEQVQELYSNDTEVHSQVWSATWDRTKKIQWIWEKFALRLIEIADKHGNVVFDYRDEWSYSNQSSAAAEPHWRKFFKSRGQLWADRSDQADWRIANPIVSPYGSSPTMKTEGPPYDHHGVRVEAWIRATAGTHYFLHNDAREPNIAAFDPDFGKDPYSDLGRKYVGYCSRLFNEHVADLDGLKPNSGLVNNGCKCIANPGKEYVVYLPHGVARVTVDLAGMKSGGTARFYDVTTGRVAPGDIPAGGAASRTFTASSSAQDWALLIQGRGGSDGVSDANEPAIVVNKGEVVFTVTEGYTKLPPAQNLAVSNGGAGTLPTLSTVLNDVPWLKTTVSGAGNGQRIKNEVIQRGLKAGQYSGSVMVTGNNLVGISYMATLIVKPAADAAKP